MKNGFAIFLTIAIIFTLTITVREETKNISLQDAIDALKNYNLTYHNTTRLLSEEGIAKYCARANFSKNISNIGKFITPYLSTNGSRELILHIVTSGYKDLIANISGVVKSCAFTVSLLLVFVTLFVILALGSIFCSSCHCCGNCCYCFFKRKNRVENPGTKASYAFLVLCMLSLGVMAFFGSGFAKTLPGSIDTMFCSVSLVTDDVMNGVNESFSVKTPTPSWIGVTTLMDKVTGLLTEIEDTINSFPTGAMSYNAQTFTDSRTALTDHLKGGNLFTHLCQMDTYTCSGTPYTPYGFSASFIDQIRPALITEIDTIEELWKNIVNATSMRDQINGYKEQAGSQIGNAQSTVDSLVGTITSFSDQIDKYLGIAEKPMNIVSIVITWFFVGWGVLGAILVISICAIDKCGCRIFWICNHISWIIMHINLTLVMILCAVFVMITFALENGCDLIEYYYPDNLASVPKVGEMIGGMSSCISGDGKLINQMLSVESIEGLFSMVEEPLLAVQQQLSSNNVVGTDGHIKPPVIGEIKKLFSSYLSYQGQKVYNTNLDATPFLFIAGVVPSYDLETDIKTQLSTISTIKEVKFMDTACSSSYAKIYTSNSSSDPGTDSCLVLTGPNINPHWKSAGLCTDLVCSSICPIRCLDDYFTSADTTLSNNNNAADRYTDILTEYSIN
jgi:hypothetical protein